MSPGCASDDHAGACGSTEGEPTRCHGTASRSREVCSITKAPSGPTSALSMPAPLGRVHGRSSPAARRGTGRDGAGALQAPAGRDAGMHGSGRPTAGAAGRPDPNGSGADAEADEAGERAAGCLGIHGIHGIHHLHAPPGPHAHRRHRLPGPGRRRLKEHRATGLDPHSAERYDLYHTFGVWTTTLERRYGLRSPQSTREQHSHT